MSLKLLWLTKSQDAITYKGQKLYPSELENILLSHPAVVDAAVTSIPASKESHNNHAGEVPHGFVVVAPSPKQAAPTVTMEELLEFANRKFGNQRDLEWKIQITGTIPRSPAGKVLRRELKKMAGFV